jgi:diketogulonate reductase-like aldo/keto reductase
MEYKTLRSGERVPALGLGTWLIGGERGPNYSQDESSLASLKAALELGYTFIDTAEMYADGHCEELIGQAIQGRDRKKLFLVSKVWANHHQYNEVIAAARRSLARLGTTYIDLYIIHKPNKEVPIEETMRALDILVDKGLIRYIGLSNFSLADFKEAEQHTKHGIVAHQIEYSLLTRNNGKYGTSTHMESETIPYCQKNGILMMTVRPLERGLLTTKDHPLLAELSAKYNKTPAQIALNWLISKPLVVPIPKASNREHLQENLGALGWQLEKKDIERLDKTNFKA